MACVSALPQIFAQIFKRGFSSVCTASGFGRAPNLEQLFHLNLPIVVCQAKPILHTLWDFGLYGPRTVWDIVIYERANSLGKIHILNP